MLIIRTVMIAAILTPIAVTGDSQFGRRKVKKVLGYSRRPSIRTTLDDFISREHGLRWWVAWTMSRLGIISTMPANICTL